MHHRPNKQKSFLHSIFVPCLFLAIFLLTLPLLSCTLFEGRETTGQYVDDSTISAKVREAFVGDPLVQATQVHVETMQGTVQLSGFVDSAKAEARAVTLARQVNGVQSVTDNIIVRASTSN